MKVAAVDVGGTSLRSALVDTATGALAHYRVSPSRSAAGPRVLVEQIMEQLAGLERQAQRMGVGLGGGPVDHERGRIRGFTAGIPGWEDFPLESELQARTGLAVRVENDANAAALAEWRFGNHGATRVLVYVTWSTGVSSGLVVEGRLFRGAFGTAGEVGHVPVGNARRRCVCGGTGCLEATVSGRVLDAARDAPRAYRRKLGATGAPWARGLRTLVNLLGPEVVVVGGSIALARFERIQAAWERARSGFLPPMDTQTRLSRSAVGEANVLVGAALAAEQAL